MKSNVTSSIVVENVPGALQSPNGITWNWYSPCGVAKAVFSRSAGSTYTCHSGALRTVWLYEIHFSAVFLMLYI